MEFNQGNNPTPNPSGPEGSGDPVIRRGTQARLPLKMGIIGGGKACDDLLTLLVEEHVSPLNIEILGVSDPNPEAPGMIHARRLVHLHYV